MRGFGGVLTFLIIFELYNGGLEHWAKIPHVSNAETVSENSFTKKELQYEKINLIINVCSSK